MPKEPTNITIDLEKIIELLPGNVFCKGVDGRYLLCNQTVADVLGFNEPNDIIGLTEYDILSREVAAKVVETDNLVFENDIEQTFEETNYDGNGIPTHYLSKKAPLHDKEGNVFALLGVSIDITQRKLAEAALADAKKKADQANQAKSDFLATISHDLRTPLNGIFGMAQLLELEQLKPEQATYVNYILDSCKNLLDLIENLLDLTTIEAQRFPFKPQTVNLRSVLEQLSANLAIQANTKSLRLSLEYPEDVNELVYTDSTAIKRIIMNLVGNAIKFTEKGHVIIGVENIQNKLRVAVRDTGPGIPDEKLNNIFERFDRGVIDTSKIKGSGLGLSIVKQLCDQMDLPLKVESKVGEGSTFYFDIPFIDRSSELPSRWHRSLSNLNILAVDNDQMSRSILLRQIGNNNNQATDANHAVDKVKEGRGKGEPYHVVLIDDDIPDPFGLLHSIRQEEAGKNIIAILFRKASSILNIDKALESGFAMQLIKPIQTTELFDSISRAWQKKQSTKCSVEERIQSLNPNVLLVEDDKIACLATTTLLTRLGCTVDTAATGEQALNLVSSGYEMIFMDINLPDINGYILTQEIRKRENPRYPTPIVALTAHTGALVEKSKIERAGFSSIASKPVTIEMLRDLLLEFVLRDKPELPPSS